MKNNTFKQLQSRFLDEVEEDEGPFGVERFLDVHDIESRDDARHVLWEMLDRGKLRTTSEWRYKLVKEE